MREREKNNSPELGENDTFTGTDAGGKTNNNPKYTQ